jgi:hypothetical protein
MKPTRQPCSPRAIHLISLDNFRSFTTTAIFQLMKSVSKFADPDLSKPQTHGESTNEPSFSNETKGKG